MKLVGTQEATKSIEIIFNIFKNSEAEIRPHFVLTGASGSGKSVTISTMAKKHNIGYFEINAAQLTKEGTSGNSLSKALTPLSNLGGKPTICFVDEFDKLFISGNSNSELAHESTNGVQNEFLKVLESNTATVFGDYGKYIEASASNVLFVFAGAFNGEENIGIDRLRELGIKTEFLGRVGLAFSLKKLTLEDLFQVLENSPLLTKYLELFIDADKEKTILEIKAYLQKTYANNTLGARIITTLINQYFINGKLTDNEVKQITFQNKMKLKE